MTRWLHFSAAFHAAFSFTHTEDTQPGHWPSPHAHFDCLDDPRANLDAACWPSTSRTPLRQNRDLACTIASPPLRNNASTGRLAIRQTTSHTAPSSWQPPMRLEFCTFWVGSFGIWTIWVDITKLHGAFRENLHRWTICHQAARHHYYIVPSLVPDTMNLLTVPCTIAPMLPTY